MVTRRRCDPGIDEGGWIGVDLFQIKDRGDTESRFSLSSRRMEMTTKRFFWETMEIKDFRGSGLGVYHHQDEIETLSR